MSLFEEFIKECTSTESRVPLSMITLNVPGWKSIVLTSIQKSKIEISYDDYYKILELHFMFGPLSLYFSCMALMTTYDISILVMN